MLEITLENSVSPQEASARVNWESKETNREHYFAVISHELRSPLATIVTALEVISSSPEDSHLRRQAIHVAERQAMKSLTLIEDLFDFSAGHYGKLTLHLETVDLRRIVADAIETTHHLFQARGHVLATMLPAKPVSLRADALRLEQVLTNLLSNAAKYCGPGGQIRLSVEDDLDHVRLRVRDNGRGIAPEFLPKVFDLFAQAQTTSAPCDGLGLGLALVKSIVELHGGSVTVASNGPGTGSEFTVCLPKHRDVE